MDYPGVIDYSMVLISNHMLIYSELYTSNTMLYLELQTFAKYYTFMFQRYSKFNRIKTQPIVILSSLISGSVCNTQLPSHAHDIVRIVSVLWWPIQHAVDVPKYLGTWPPSL